MKYYLIFLNTLGPDVEVVSLSSFDDEDSQERQYQSCLKKLDTYGSDWLMYPQVEYHKVQKFSEV